MIHTRIIIYDKTITLILLYHRPGVHQPKLTAVQENVANQKAQRRPASSPADVRASRVRSPPKKSQPLPEHRPEQKPQGKGHIDGGQQRNPPGLSRLHEGHPLPNEGVTKPINKPFNSIVEGRQPSDEPIYAVPRKDHRTPTSPIPQQQPAELQLPLLDKTDNPESGYSSPVFPELLLDNNSRILPNVTRKGKHGGRSHAKNLNGPPFLSESDLWTPQVNKTT